MDFGKIALIGIGGYLLYHFFGSSVTSSFGGSPADTGTAKQNTVPTTPTNQKPLRDMLLAAVSANHEAPPLSFDQWNWYYANVRGIPGPSWEDATGGTGDRSYRYTVDEYLAIMGAKGFSGPMGSVFGPTGYEAAYKRYVS